MWTKNGEISEVIAEESISLFPFVCINCMKFYMKFEGVEIFHHYFDFEWDFNHLKFV